MAYQLDPLADPRWDEFLARTPGASIFHSPGWLRSLRDAYGYEPVVFTTSAPGAELRNGIVFCRVESWLTGKRHVSIPFADHGVPLLDGEADLPEILAAVAEDSSRRGYRFYEIRSQQPLADGIQTELGLGESGRFAFHIVPLDGSPDDVYAGFHNTSIRQRIRRAGREGVTVSRGRDSRHRDEFYQLLLGTRRKHRVPPQPSSWYRILAENLGETITFHVARRSDRPIAAIVTLRYGDTLVYKYGCSDMTQAKYGGTQVLLWEAIRESMEDGAKHLDMGRSDLDNPGLIKFKMQWGGQETSLHYYRSPAPSAAKEGSGWMHRFAGNVVAALPDSLLSLAGRLLYKHVG